MEIVTTKSQELHEKGLRAFELGDFESASRLFWSGLQLGETSELWNDWATARLQLGERSVAEQGFRRALDLNQSSPEAAINLGILLAGANRYDEAISLLEQGRAGCRQDNLQVTELLQWCRQQAAAAVPQQPRAAISGTTGSKIVMFPVKASIVNSPRATAIAEPDGKKSTERVQSAVLDVRPGVVFEGIVYGGSGYADETVAVLTGLHQHGVSIRLECTNKPNDDESILPGSVNNTLEAMKHTPIRLAESIHLHSAPAHDFQPGIYAKHRVGRTMFETDSIPVSWVERCRMMDEIWVPSEFNRQTFSRAGVAEGKIRVMNAGVDTNLFRPGHEPFPLPIYDCFKFLSVFEWTGRKGPDILLRAFLREFKADEGVALVLRSYARPDPSVDLVPRIAQFIEQEAGLTIETSPPIVVVSGFMKNSDMPRLYNAADAFVLPSRGEGYGRPYMEALACGVPVLGTAWSGQTDFLTAENSFPVAIEGVVPVPDSTEVDTYYGHCWAEPSVEDLQQQMRRVFGDAEGAKQRAQRGRQDMVERWDWKIVLQNWQKRIQELLS
jgi:glycosyltransferase involved in cell wall biosynthesis